MKRAAMKPTHVLDRSTLLHFEKGGYRISALPPFRNFRALDIPWDQDEVLADEAERIAKSSGSRKVVHLAAGQYGLPIEVHVKRYTFKSPLKLLLSAARKSRAREDFELGWKLLSKRIKTPRPVWLAESKGPVARYSILATESIPEAESALDRWRRCSNEKQRGDLCIAVGQFTAMLTDVGFYHDNYRAMNLLLRPGRPSCASEFHLTDLQGGSFPTLLTNARRARMLFQLIRSFIPKHYTLGFREEHRQMILKAYCGSNIDAEVWEKRVASIARSKDVRI